MSEKICPNCKNKNEIHALVCIHCGAALNGGPQVPTVTGLSPQISINQPVVAEKVSVDEERIPPDNVAFHVVDVDRTVYVHIEPDTEVVLGRKIHETDTSLLDLRELGGYQMGLSRRHAKIRRTASGYEVIDLASTNGSWLNNQRLIPNKPYALENGAYLKLGHMRLYFFYRPRSS